MKKVCVLFVAGTLVGAANAATKCVADGDVKCASSGTWGNKYDFGATCMVGEVAVEWRGVAGCSADAGGDNVASDVLSITGDRVNCWCKLIVPFETKWRFYYGPSSEWHCESYCATNCANSTASYGWRRDWVYFKK